MKKNQISNEEVKELLVKKQLPIKPHKETDLSNQLFSDAELRLFRSPDIQYKRSYVYLIKHHINRKMNNIHYHLENWIEIAVNYDHYLNYKKPDTKNELIAELENALKELKEYVETPDKPYLKKPIELEKNGEGKNV